MHHLCPQATCACFRRKRFTTLALHADEQWHLNVRPLMQRHSPGPVEHWIWSQSRGKRPCIAVGLGVALRFARHQPKINTGLIMRPEDPPDRWLGRRAPAARPIRNHWNLVATLAQRDWADAMVCLFLSTTWVSGMKTRVQEYGGILDTQSEAFKASIIHGHTLPAHKYAQFFNQVFLCSSVVWFHVRPLVSKHRLCLRNTSCWFRHFLAPCQCNGCCCKCVLCLLCDTLVLSCMMSIFCVKEAVLAMMAFVGHVTPRLSK